MPSFEKIEKAIKKSGGRLGLALNPETPLETILPYIDKVSRVLIMT
jgi:pentose-5-phosphate-3-epimerase